MADIDPARIEIVEALGCIEDAHLAAMPGQAPRSTRDDITEAIRKARRLIKEALKHLDNAERIVAK
ncbi:MAG: hypothetical protein AAFY34_09755 [Pseudomonadota bacterium]